jgi:hypothetical protein
MNRINRILIVLIVASSLVCGAVTANAATPRWFQPIAQLPRSTFRTFACVIWHESRSTFTHPNLRDNNGYGSSGIFQIEQGTWAAHQLAAGVPLRVHVWQASESQQASVAAAIDRADGFGPWSADWMCF